MNPIQIILNCVNPIELYEFILGVWTTHELVYSVNFNHFIPYVLIMYKFE
jgi:hypothetical protein